MKSCSQCKVLVNTERKTCPLCFTLLNIVDGKEALLVPYPKYQSKPVRYNVFYRVLVFLSIIATFICVLVNIFTYKENHNLWSLVVIAGFLYLWILFRSTLRGTGNIPRRLVIQMLTLSSLIY